jgi:hypothetical protein
MSDNKTAEEAKQEYIEKMGEPLGMLFNELWQELAWLHMKWGEFLELYGKKPSRIKLLNEVAPSFFRLVQDSLWEDILLHIARLTDPPSSAGKPNLTIRRLPELIDDEETSLNVSLLIAEADNATEFCRDWRNRHIAHRDLDLALKRRVKPLESVSRQRVQEAMKAIDNVLDAVTRHFTNSTTAFDAGAISGGALSLLHRIADGLKAEERQRERLLRGEYEPDDFQPRDI